MLYLFVFFLTYAKTTWTGGAKQTPRHTKCWNTPKEVTRYDQERHHRTGHGSARHQGRKVARKVRRDHQIVLRGWGQARL